MAEYMREDDCADTMAGVMAAQEGQDPHRVTFDDIKQLGGQVNRLTAENDTLRRERLNLYDLLADVAAYLDDHIDVIDGDDGTPRPNRAMVLHTRVEQMLLAMDARNTLAGPVR